MNLLRWRRRYGRRTLIAEQLIGRGLIAGTLAAVVEDILVMVTAILVIVQRLGLACVHLRERRLWLIVLRIAGRVLEGTAGGRGGRFVGPRRGRASCAGRTWSRRTSSQLMFFHRINRQIILIVAVLVQTAMEKTDVQRIDRSRRVATLFRVTPLSSTSAWIYETRYYTRYYITQSITVR